MRAWFDWDVLLAAKDTRIELLPLLPSTAVDNTVNLCEHFLLTLTIFKKKLTNCKYVSNLTTWAAYWGEKKS